jgi:HSP20 family protein
MTRVFLNRSGRGGQLFDVVRREVDDFVNRLSDPESWTDESTSFSPRTNVAETERLYEVTVDLPGMNPDELSLEVHEGRLSIAGERKREEIKEGKTFHRVERLYGKFHRAFTLGQDVNADGISAEYKDGVLTVTVPKEEKDQPKKIHVKTS